MDKVKVRNVEHYASAKERGTKYAIIREHQGEWWFYCWCDSLIEASITIKNDITNGIIVEFDSIIVANPR